MKKVAKYIYKNELLLLNIYIGECYERIPYVLNLVTNLIFSEKDFHLLSKRLERRNYRNMSQVLEYARYIVTEKNKNITKKEFFEITLDDTILTKKSYSFGKLSRKIKSSYIKNISVEGPCYNQAVVFIKDTYRVINITTYGDANIENEIKLLNAVNGLKKRKFLDSKRFVRALYKKLDFPSKSIQLSFDNKYREKHLYTFSLKSNKILREKRFYNIRKGNYHIELLYLVKSKTLSPYSLGRTSRGSIDSMIEKIAPLAYEIRISGGVYPIKIQTVKIKNKKLLKQ